MQRNRWRRIAMTVGAMLIVLLLAASWRFLQSRGVFASVAEVSPAACRTVRGVTDVTAIAPDPRAAMTFVASRQGEVYAWRDGAVVKMSGTPKDFRPVALDIVLPQDAGTKLLAVFGRADESFAIAVFDVAPGKLTEVSRLTTDVLTDPAGLASLDGNRFYLVNRHGSRTALGRWLDDTFLLPRADVLYFDGLKFVTVAERLNSPAGIALSPDNMRLYVSEDYPRALASFARNDFTGGLDDPAVLSIPAGPRSINVTPDGTLIVAARPKAGAGQIWRVRTEGGVPGSADLIYSAKDQEVIAAAELNGHLLIGTGDKLLDCRL